MQIDSPRTGNHVLKMLLYLKVQIFNGKTIMEGNIIVLNKRIEGTIETQTTDLQWRIFHCTVTENTVV